jgi:hypothetical protein
LVAVEQEEHLLHLPAEVIVLQLLTAQKQQQAVVVVVVIHLKELVATMLQQLEVLEAAVHMQTQQVLLVRQVKALLEVRENSVVTIPAVAEEVQQPLVALQQQPQAMAVMVVQE